jgi:hypothetical protein
MPNPTWLYSTSLAINEYEPNTPYICIEGQNLLKCAVVTNALRANTEVIL